VRPRGQPAPSRAGGWEEFEVRRAAVERMQAGEDLDELLAEEGRKSEYWGELNRFRSLTPERTRRQGRAALATRGQVRGRAHSEGNGFAAEGRHDPVFSFDAAAQTARAAERVAPEDSSLDSMLPSVWNVALTRKVSAERPPMMRPTFITCTGCPGQVEPEPVDQALRVEPGIVHGASAGG